MRRTIQIVCVGAACVFLGSAALADVFGTDGNQFTIDFVMISGNTNPDSGYGIVSNDYRMGVHEITNSQWGKFKASLGVPVTGNPTNAYDHDLYWLGTNPPAVSVSWHEAAQLVNWLNTSTGHQAVYKFTGTQGTTDYALATWSPAEAAGGTNLYRHKDAMYYMPTEDEWVKAAYWNGTTLQTYSNVFPHDLIAGVPDPAKWNYASSAVGQPWDVGSGSEELNGTFDMMGNVWEWTESPYSDTNYGTGSDRGLRGGPLNGPASFLASSYRGNTTPYNQGDTIGFRVASIPEPASATLLAIGFVTMFCRRKK